MNNMYCSTAMHRMTQDTTTARTAFAHPDPGSEDLLPPATFCLPACLMVCLPPCLPAELNDKRHRDDEADRSTEMNNERDQSI